MRTLEFVAGGSAQFAQGAWTEVGQGVALEPSPHVRHGIQVRRVGRQKCDLDVFSQAAQILPSQTTAMRLERLEEFDDLFLLLDCPRVQPKQAVGAGEPGDDRDVVPAEMKLDDGCLSLGCSITYSGRALADTGLVYEDNQMAFSLGFF